MASGCILETCLICDLPIYEDEEFIEFYDDEGSQGMVHKKCLKKLKIIRKFLDDMEKE